MSCSITYSITSAHGHKLKFNKNIAFIVVLHFRVTAVSSTMRITNTLKWMWNDH